MHAFASLFPARSKEKRTRVQICANNSSRAVFPTLILPSSSWRRQFEEIAQLIIIDLTAPLTLSAMRSSLFCQSCCQVLCSRSRTSVLTPSQYEGSTTIRRFP